MENIHSTFTLDPLHIDDVVVYLKNERTGTSTIRKCKFIGHVVGFTKTKVEIRRLSLPDIFVTPDEMQDFGIDTIYSDDVVSIVISKYQEDDHTRTLKALNKIVDKQRQDINLLLGKWFSLLDDRGLSPWIQKDFIDMANRYQYDMMKEV